jgi:hypothetical protein
MSEAGLALDVLWKAAGVARRLGRAVERARDRRRATYAAEVPAGPLARCFPAVEPGALRQACPHVGEVARLWLSHRFDLLGSGWVHVRHGTRCGGLEGHRYGAAPFTGADPEGRWLESKVSPANLGESRRLWRLVDPGYEPIDWQRDFKSGLRWTERMWHGDVPIGPVPGADVKVPWELARMQHLPQLALAGALGVAGCDREFRNEVLDFLATNPPRFGVNWRSTMDVAIRVANWLVAFDLFRAHGATFDADFEAALARGAYEHGRHIVDHLEWHPRLRGNHYLANIAGLLFIAAHLPRVPVTDAWLAFAVQELIAEVERQFHPDGSCFEGSTCYHRLSAEMVVHATALTLALPAERREALERYDHRLIRGRPRLRQAPLRPAPFPEWYWERLARMADFTRDITKPNGRVSQIGDNDSGRFLKLQTRYRRLSVAEARARYLSLEGYAELPDDAAYWDEDDLDHRSLVAAIDGVLGGKGGFVAGASGGRESPVCGLQQGAHGPRSSVAGALEEWERLHAQLAGADGAAEIALPAEDAPLRRLAYPDFGLYLFRSERVYLLVRCGPIGGPGGRGGHTHNDQLSVELTVDGEDRFTDPGTFVYTALPERRNQYRSVRSHAAPRLDGREPGRLDLGLFRLGDEARARCLYFGERGFAGLHHGYGPAVCRLIELLPGRLRIVDAVMDGRAWRPLPVRLDSEVPPTAGYGKVVRP